MPTGTTVESAVAPASDDRARGRLKRPRARSDGAYWVVLYSITALFVVVCIALIYSLVTESFSAWAHSGLSLIYGTTWNPDNEQYGALPLIVGTLVTSAIALVLAIPIGILVAISLVHLVPLRLRTPLASFV